MLKDKEHFMSSLHHVHEELEDLDTSERAKRFVSALEDLIETGEGWESEIEREVRLLDPDEFTGFLQQAVGACSVLSGIVRNMLDVATVRLPKAKRGMDDPRTMGNDSLI